MPATLDDLRHRPRVLLLALGVACAGAVAAALLLTNGGSPSGVMTLPVASPRTSPPPHVSAIEAVSLPEQQQTVYSVTPVDGAVYAWRFSPPPAEPGCNDFGVVPGSPNSAVWHLGGCGGVPIGQAGHLGTITVTVSAAGWRCTAQILGSRDGDGPPPAPCRR